MKVIDCRGMPGPEPVLTTRRVLKDMEFPVEVKVDSLETMVNLCRFLGNTGYRYQTINDQGVQRIIISGMGKGV